MRWFHNAGAGMMVATQSLREELTGRGFKTVLPWSRGVDLAQFQPEPREAWDMPRPIFAYVGRVAIEKNIEAFLSLDLPGSKLVVGDGPARAGLERHFPNAHFAGVRHGAPLAAAFAGADVFVFPSLTDTFGLVMLESLACGTPVAAFPVTGPKDVLAGGIGIGAVDADLRAAALQALATGDRVACREYAERFSWRACAEVFLANLVPVGGAAKATPARRLTRAAFAGPAAPCYRRGDGRSDRVLKKLLRNAAVQALTARAVGAYLSFALHSTRWTIVGEANLARSLAGAPVIATFWHERLPLIPALWILMQKRGVRGTPHVLISKHRDGRFIAAAVRRFGVQVVHGSSSKNGSARDMAEKGAARACGRCWACWTRASLC